MADCKENIISEEYGDFILEYGVLSEVAYERYKDYCPQFINNRYMSLYERLDNVPNLGVANNTYVAIPKLYGLMDTTAVAATGAIRLQNQTGFEYTGRGVIVGFIDTGIDYTNKMFQNSTGQTRIIGIWDQTDETGTPPNVFNYGSQYTLEEINEALASDNPRSIIPHTDEIGHGTFMAGVACGSYDEQQDFVGSAPDCYIAMVKLKPAKQYLKEFFLIDGEGPVYQENDIMMAAAYLRTLRIRHQVPLVIVLGIGTGSGDREGGSPLAQYLSDLGQFIGDCVVVCSGNEANEGLHYKGRVSNDSVEDVEIRVGDNDNGFVLELWGKAPDLFSVSFISPLGESVPRIPARKDATETLEFLLDGTTIELYYSLVENGNGNELIFMRFIKPSPGVWTIRVYGSNILSGEFNIWANLRQFMNKDTYFLRPDPDSTLTVPSSAENVITIGGYDSSTNAIYPKSGRGFTIGGEVKPDMTAPSVAVYGPDVGAGTVASDGFTRKTGTSVGAALAAGCCAQMLEWGFVDENDLYMNGVYIKNYLLRGAERDRDITYPSRQWGYGKLNVFNSFIILTRT